MEQGSLDYTQWVVELAGAKIAVSCDSLTRIWKIGLQ